MVYLFLATGFEETEALAPTDLMRRAGIKVQLVSITGDTLVTGSHGITVKADSLFEETDFSDGELLVLPGGMPGTRNLDAYADLRELLQFFFYNGKKIAAICAAPMILGNLGILNGAKATCYPGYEDYLIGADFKSEKVVYSDPFVTSRGMGTSIEFGLKLVEILKGKEIAEKLSGSIIFK